MRLVPKRISGLISKSDVFGLRISVGRFFRAICYFSPQKENTNRKEVFIYNTSRCLSNLLLISCHYFVGKLISLWYLIVRSSVAVLYCSRIPRVDARPTTPKMCYCRLKKTNCLPLF